MRLVMKPGDSRITTTSLPMRRPTAAQACTVASEVSRARTISSSFIFGTGLKKCMPMQSAARKVMAASSVIGERRSVAGENCAGAGEFVEDGENFQFHFHFFGDGFDEQVGFAADVFDGARGGEIRQRGGFLFWRHFAAGDAFVEGLRGCRLVPCSSISGETSSRTVR